MEEMKKQREKQKRFLKQNVIQFNPPEGELGRELRKRKIQKVLVRTLVLGAILFCIFFTWRYSSASKVYQGYREVWSSEILEGASSQYEKFGSNVLKYTKDGASYLDSTGKQIWNITYQMKTPIVAVNGSYAAFADQKGNNVTICNREGSTGSFTTNLPILKVTVSAHGVVAVIVEDVTFNYIHFYASDGRKLDIGVMTQLAKEGYPLDISLSPKGTQLIASYVYLDSGILQSHIVFRNFSEKGKNLNDRFLGGFPHDGTIVPRVEFLSEEYAVAVGDNMLLFYNLVNELSPTEVQVPVQGEIRTLFYNESYVGYIVENPEGEERYKLCLYTKKGGSVFEKEFSFDYTKVEIGTSMIILYNSTECQIYGLKGNLRYQGGFEQEIMNIIEDSQAGRLIVTESTQIRGIQLK